MEQNWLFIVIAAVILVGAIALAVWRVAYPSRWHLNMLRYGRGKSRHRAMHYFTKHFDIKILPFAFAIMESESAAHNTRALSAAMLTKALDGERAKKILGQHLDHEDIHVRKNSIISLITLDPWTPLPPLFKSLSGLAMDSDFQESDGEELIEAVKRRLAASPTTEEETPSCRAAVFEVLPKLKNAYIQGPVSHRFLFYLELLRLLNQGPDQLVNAYADYMHAFPMESLIRHFLEAGFNRDILFRNIETALSSEDTFKHRVKGLLMFLEQGAIQGSWDLTGRESFDILNKVLYSDVWRHRAGAVKCMLLASNEFSFDRLLTVRELDEHEEVRTTAAQALKELGFDDLLSAGGLVRTERAAGLLMDLWLNRKLEDYDEKIFPKKDELVNLAATLVRKPIPANKLAKALEHVIIFKESPKETQTVTQSVESLIGLEVDKGRKTNKTKMDNNGEDYSGESTPPTPHTPRTGRLEIDQVALLDYTAHLV